MKKLRIKQESNVDIPSPYQAEHFGSSSLPSPSFYGDVPASHSKKVKTPAKKSQNGCNRIDVGTVTSGKNSLRKNSLHAIRVSNCACLTGN